ncbi:hypothetical protein KR093_010015 [Drosophila rubida]|uniref:Protein sleepless n=1 Tax=Drosophila rubida TaxID=30044 RepID=A0AAD4K634_9MUSC|nr:hypothetical protein KR093_010015 [Drosophila rubida]
MWRKVILSLVLVAFVGLQLGESDGKVSEKNIILISLYFYTGNSLTCYSCNSPQSCLNPDTQVCSNATANTTTDWLNAIHSDVPKINTSEGYKCMNLTYFIYANMSKTAEILGCMRETVPFCSLTLNVSNSATWAKNCKSCTTDYCNRNPAGTFSKSTYTIIACVVALILAKLRSI